VAKLPIMSGREVVRLLTKMGFRVVGRKRSHIKMKKRDEKVTVVVVPDHRELARGTLRSIFRRADLTPDDLKRLVCCR
jgi:predicted RNA binding protein YcfA (HicA-like mRNA interferase family)